MSVTQTLLGVRQFSGEKRLSESRAHCTRQPSRELSMDPGNARIKMMKAYPSSRSPRSNEEDERSKDNSWELNNYLRSDERRPTEHRARTFTNLINIAHFDERHLCTVELHCYCLFTIMNLTRQPLLKDVHNFFRFRRWQLSNTCTFQHNRGEIICKRSMSSEANGMKQTLAVDASSELNPVRH